MTSDQKKSTPFFINIIKCIQNYITPEFPKLGFVNKLQGVCELIKSLKNVF